MICYWSFRSGDGALRSKKTSERKGPQRVRGLEMVEGGFWMEGFSGWRVTSRRLDMAEDSGWTLRVVNVLRGSS